MVFGIEIPLYLGKVSGRYQEGDLKTNFLINSKIPIAIYSRKFEGYTEKTVDFKKEELIGRIENKISEKIKSDGIKEYETLNVKIEQNSDILRITKEISCCENIAYQDILLFNSANWTVLCYNYKNRKFRKVISVVWTNRWYPKNRTTC